MDITVAVLSTLYWLAQKKKSNETNRSTIVSDESLQTFDDKHKVIETPLIEYHQEIPKPKMLAPMRTANIDVSNNSELIHNVLLHNVSHTDMLMSVLHNGIDLNDAIARPKFSHFRRVSEDIFKKLLPLKPDDMHTMNYPVYTRVNNKRFPLKKLQENYKLPVGLDLSNLNVNIEDINAVLRFRTQDNNNFTNVSKCQLSAVYFPLVAILIPKWLAQIETIHGLDCKKTIFLISGHGSPRDVEAHVRDNSTEVTAKIMKLYIEKAYPTIHVELVNSQTTNLFRYDENIFFVKNELMPKVNLIRNDIANRLGEKWKDFMHVTLSFADGSSARVSAINAALRPYKPWYMHFWQLKTFWYEMKVCEDDIDLHSYEEISTSPAVGYNDVNEDVKLVVDEMRLFREKYEEMMLLPAESHDMNAFWLRKSGKLVLAVLLVRKKGGMSKLYRGTNMEVSMPTGSLCAERNVIGSALADDLSLKREDILVVAVLSLSLQHPKINDTPSYSRFQELNIDSIQSIENHKCASFGCQGDNCTISNNNEVLSPAVLDEVEKSSRGNSSEMENISLLEDAPSSNPLFPTMATSSYTSTTQSLRPPKLISDISTSSNASTSHHPKSSKSKKREVQIFESKSPGRITLETPKVFDQDHTAEYGNNAEGTVDIEDSTVPRMVLPPAIDYSNNNYSSSINGQSFQTNGMRPSFATTNVSSDGMAFLGRNESFAGPLIGHESISVDKSDLNPLKPCGACHEWLKKIAEVNPSFSVVTFTDMQCKGGVYVEYIGD